MGHGISSVAAAGLVIASMPAAVHAGEPRTDVVVGVTMRTSVAPDVLSRALDVATAVYAAAGVSVAFVLTEEMFAVEATSRRHLIVVASAPLGPGPQAHSLGIAGRSSAEPGETAYVFFDNVARTAVGRSVPVADLLGYAMAHELGHMLLPGGHGERGVMRAVWVASDFDAIRKHSLMLGDREASAIATYLDSSAHSR